MNKLAGALVPLLFLGCATTGSVAVNTPPPPKYDLTLSGSLDGGPFTGVALGSQGPSHTITISSSDTIPYVIAQSCHRDEMHEKVISQGWFSQSKSWSFSYNLAPTIEDSGSCPLRLCAYSSTVGAPPVQCAVVDFKNALFTEPAMNICNGANGQTSGTMICKTKIGLEERVQFTEPMIVAPMIQPTAAQGVPYLITNQCAGDFIDSSNQLFRYYAPQAECYVVFATLRAPHRMAHLLVIPYNTNLPTGGN